MKGNSFAVLVAGISLLVIAVEGETFEVLSVNLIGAFDGSVLLEGLVEGQVLDASVSSSSSWDFEVITAPSVAWNRNRPTRSPILC